MTNEPQGPGWWQASDGRWYAPQGPMQGPPPRSGMSGCLKALLIGLAVAAVVGLGACVVLVVAVDEAGDEAEQQLTEEDARESEDLGEPTCEVDGAGYMAADIEVTNNSSERSNYSIEVTFEGPDGSQIETASAAVSALEPGQATTATAQTLTEPPAGEFSCRIVEVERFSDE